MQLNLTSRFSGNSPVYVNLFPGALGLCGCAQGDMRILPSVKRLPRIYSRAAIKSFSPSIHCSRIPCPATLQNNWIYIELFKSRDGCGNINKCKLITLGREWHASELIRLNRIEYATRREVRRYINSVEFECWAHSKFMYPSIKYPRTSK